MIWVLSIDDIIAENYRLTGNACDEERKKKVEGCYSSFCYYHTTQAQITNIVISLIKGHFFLNGNKRTALSVYLVLSMANGLDYIKDPMLLVEVFNQIAASNKNTEEQSKLLYPDILAD